MRFLFAVIVFFGVLVVAGIFHSDTMAGLVGLSAPFAACWAYFSWKG